MSTILHVSTIQGYGYRRGEYMFEGPILEGCSADVEPGVSIRIYGEYPNHVDGPKPFDQTFRLSDSCEYDSYNLKYTGTIVGIGPKSVVVDEVSTESHSVVAVTERRSHGWMSAYPNVSDPPTDRRAKFGKT